MWNRKTRMRVSEGAGGCIDFQAMQHSRAIHSRKIDLEQWKLTILRILLILHKAHQTDIFLKNSLRAAQVSVSSSWIVDCHYTFSKEETRSIGVAVLVGFLVQRPRNGGGTAEKLRIVPCVSALHLRMAAQRRTTPMSDSGCFSARDANVRSQFGRPKWVGARRDVIASSSAPTSCTCNSHDRVK